MEKLIKLSGVFIFLSVILTLYSYFIESRYLMYAGILLWLSFFILFSTLKKKRLIIILFVLSILSFFISYINDYPIDIIKVITINQNLITLLVTVSFLRLINITSNVEDNNSVPKGRKSFFTTYFSLYIFSSVINFSSLVLIADKLYKRSALSSIQIILLTRSFASNVYWSPFFASFAVAVTYAPNLNTSIVILNGIILSFAVYLLTYFEVTRDKSLNINEFEGYPFSLNSLILPSVLALLVLSTNYFYKDIKVIILISIFSLILSFGSTLFIDGFFKSIDKFKSFILKDLPNMKSELSLFIVAGMFGVSISSILLGLNITLPTHSFDWISASILLLVFILLGFIGIHPVITVAIIGNYIVQVDNTLFAVTFLMAWATNVSTSPFSGLNLTMASKYNLNASKVFNLNIKYSLKIYLMSILSLYILSKYLNL